MASLASQHPTTPPTPLTPTPTELSRFLVANKGNVADRDSAVADYLNWRKEYLPQARILSEEAGPPASRWWGFIQNADGTVRRSTLKPKSRLVLACGGFHLCGSGCSSPDLEVPVETTIAAMSNWVEGSLDRNSDEKITLLVDVRPKEDWPNPSPTSLLPLVRGLSKIFGENNPERLEACVIFPMPWYVMAVWYIAQVFLDPKTAKKVVFLAGSSYEGAPAPEGLKAYCDDDPTMLSFVGGCGGVARMDEVHKIEQTEEVQGGGGSCSTGEEEDDNVVL